MCSDATTLEETGLEVIDLQDDPSFAMRQLGQRDAQVQLEGLRRLSRAMAKGDEAVLQELVDAAVSLCGADSAGISLERDGATREAFYHWVATAGEYRGFLDAILPQYPSACGVCLHRGRPQRFRVSKRFFDILGVEAAPVTDGLLLPWMADETRGTIFVMAHGRDSAFDGGDARTMETLADFAVMAIRQQKQRKLAMQRANAAAAAAMAHDLAHQINNPLQSLTNLVYLGQNGHGGTSQTLAGELAGDLQRLSALVRDLLALPSQQIRS